MKVLVMGGTQFNGRALVAELARCGHDVTVCNRGKTPGDLPAGVQRLVADRTDPAALRAALAGRDWDCVQDMSAYRESDAKLMVELLRGRTGHYVFASSTVIYAASDLLPIGEDHPLERGERQNEYGMGKILCEDVLVREHRERGFPATIVRPSTTRSDFSQMLIQITSVGCARAKAVGTAQSTMPGQRLLCGVIASSRVVVISPLAIPHPNTTP